MQKDISQEPVFLEDARHGAYIIDANGTKYIDCYSSASTYNLGRRNERLISMLKQAIFETDQGNFVMISEEKALLAEKISKFVPGPLDCVLFGVTRGESMDAACKLARGATGRPGLITVDGGAYGDTGFALSLSEHSLKKDFGDLIPGIVVVPFGHHSAAEAAINRNTAAFILEPVQAEYHCRSVTTDYLKHIRSLCDSTGTCLIFDESQTGFGRTGKKFAYEHYGIYPDILVVGEAITGGMFPMTAMVFTSKLKQFFDVHPLIHLCTFGGHDVGCLVAAAALDEYEQIKPWQNALVQGAKIMNQLASVMESDDRIRSLNGLGLLISLVFSSTETANRFCLLASKNGILLRKGIVDFCCVLIRPSLLITEGEVEIINQAIRATMKDL
jgi:acetylornithine/succinyldiaminopimelate/putrescine aminotransferase